MLMHTFIHHYTSLNVKKKKVIVKLSPISISNSGFSLQQINIKGSDLLGIAQNCTPVKKRKQAQTKNDNFIYMKTRNSLTEKFCVMTQDLL